MPVSGIGSGSQNFEIASTPAIARNQTHSSSELARNIHKVQPSTSGFTRGHQRQNAVDLRVDTSINSTSFSNSVSRSTTTLVDILGSGTKIKP